MNSDMGAQREHSRSPISRSPSPRSKRLMRARDERKAEKGTVREHETYHGRRSDKGRKDRSRSPVSPSPSPHSKRLRRARDERDANKVTDKEHERNHGRANYKERHSSISRSPSPRSKRLRRVQVEKEAAKVTDREREKNVARISDKGKRSSERDIGNERKEKISERDIGNERKERISGREEVSNKSTRTRHERPTSPLDQPYRSKHRSRSPQSLRISGREEVSNKSTRRRHERSSSPLDQPYRSKHRSRSPQSADGARVHHEGKRSRGVELRNDDDDPVAKMKAAEEALEAKDKQKPSFELSGKLAAETNRFRGVTLLFNEPPDARKPDVRWRLYVFKAGEVLKEPLYIHRQSCYLFGRERRIADIPTDHPSCSKQHAVIQFRQVEKEKPDGILSKQVRPYLMDLGSTNKTYLNENPIEPQRYYELFEKDTIKFGNSSREYVLLHENSVE